MFAFLQIGLFGRLFPIGTIIDAKYYVAYVGFILLTIFGAYLFGSINSSIIISKTLYGDDIRKHGSGNAGMTNMLRTYGLGAAGLTLLGDLLKTALAILLAGIFFGFGYVGGVSIGGSEAGICYVAALFAVLGHIFPIFYGFKGGKGVAVAVGIFSVCCPLAIALGLAVFAIVLIISKIVSLSSLLATVTVVVLSIIFYDKSANILPQIILSASMGTIVFLKHIDNIKRLLSGTEKKIHVGRKK